MTSLSYAFYIGLLSGVLLAVVFIWWWRQRGGYQGALIRTVRKISRDSMSDIVVPDGVDGEIQIDHLLLTDRGLLVLDVKEIRGRLFSGENMDEWAVIDRSQRFTFANPVGPLRERIIAIKTLLSDIPVSGRVVILGDAHIPADVPDCVITLSQLHEQFSPSDRNSKKATDAFYPQWDRIRQIAEAV